MPLIWAAISAHGYGHAAQVVPVLNALGRLVPDLRVLLRTAVPPSFFKDRLSTPWELSAVQQDIGCVQKGPITIDVEATWQEHDRFHSTWADRVQAEMDAMRSVRPDVILADMPYLAVAAGAGAAVPTIALVSFTWDLVLADFQVPSSIDKPALLSAIRQAYGQADLALRLAPAPKLTLFKRTIDIDPIAEPSTPARDQLNQLLALTPGERTVLVGFGGIPMTSLPFAELESLTGYRFLFDGPIPPNSARFVSTRSLPFSFKTLMASVDVIMTKPGYGTIVEAVALQTPVVYVRRYNFADEQPIVEYLHHHGRGIELLLDDFLNAHWEHTLEKSLAMAKPKTPPPPATGAMEAAAILASYLNGTGM